MSVLCILLAVLLALALPALFVRRVTHASKADMRRLTDGSETIGRLEERIAILDMIKASYRANPTPQIKALWTMVWDRHEREMKK